jgi:DNA-binding LacI/PurR family transcriptional regulator
MFTNTNGRWFGARSWGRSSTRRKLQSRDQLTTIAEPHREKGETAARRLLEPGVQPARVVLPNHLVTRASTA